MKLMH